MLFISLFLWAFMVYTIYFASDAELRFIGSRQLDKIPHLLGGIFVAGAYERAVGRRLPALFLLSVAFIVVAWEVMEFAFIPETRFFYTISPELWRRDTVGDILAGLGGSSVYWVFGMSRKPR